MTDTPIVDKFRDFAAQETEIRVGILAATTFENGFWTMITKLGPERRFDRAIRLGDPLAAIRRLDVGNHPAEIHEDLLVGQVCADPHDAVEVHRVPHQNRTGMGTDSSNRDS